MTLLIDTMWRRGLVGVGRRLNTAEIAARLPKAWTEAHVERVVNRIMDRRYAEQAAAREDPAAQSQEPSP